MVLFLFASISFLDFVEHVVKQVGRQTILVGILLSKVGDQPLEDS